MNILEHRTITKPEAEANRRLFDLGVKVIGAIGSTTGLFGIILLYEAWKRLH